MKTNLINWVALLMLTAMFSCSDDNSSKREDDNSGTLLERVSVDQSRVTVYSKNINSRSSLASIVIPDRPENTKPMYDHVSKSKAGEVYVIEEGESYSGQLNLNNNTIYVYGTLSTNSQYGNAGTVYVMPGAKLILSGMLGNNATVICKGELEFSDSYNINHTASLTTDQDIVLNTLHTSGKLYTSGKVNVNTLDIKNNSDIFFGSCVTVEDEFKITNDAVVEVACYLSAKKIDMTTNATILLNAGSHISAEVIDVHNLTCSFQNEENDFAVIECDKYIIHQANQKKTIGPIAIHAKELENKQSKNPMEWQPDVIFDREVYIPAGDCAPGFGTSPGEEGVVLVPVIEIESMKDKISATGVGFESGKAYISWHKYGAPYDGYIDVIDMQSYTLEATLHIDSLDFNHVNVSNGNIYVAGGRKKGAFIGSVDYNNSELNLEIRKIEGSSGNCLLVDDNKIWAVSGANGGLSIINGEEPVDFKEMDFAKYVLRYNNEMVVIAGVEDTKLTHFDLNGEVVKEYSVGQIFPVDGKNAMVTDGETIYVALGNHGVKAIKNGEVVASYNTQEVDEETGRVLTAANCVDVDDKYVYVANGNAGLHILNKDDLSLVCKYSFGEASANFVKKAENGDIYVSYGLKGVNVFRLTDKIDNVAENIQ